MPLIQSHINSWLVPKLIIGFALHMPKMTIPKLSSMLRRMLKLKSYQNKKYIYIFFHLDRLKKVIQTILFNHASLRVPMHAYFCFLSDLNSQS